MHQNDERPSACNRPGGFDQSTCELRFDAVELRVTRRERELLPTLF